VVKKKGILWCIEMVTGVSQLMLLVSAGISQPLVAVSAGVSQPLVAVSAGVSQSMVAVSAGISQPVSHKSNPSSVPRGIIGSYCTVTCVAWEAVTVVEGYPDEGCYNTCWLTGLWSTQTKVEGTAPRAAWHWGRGSSVVNDPLGEPGRTTLYVGLPPVWGSVDGDLMFFHICKRAPFWGLQQTYMNE